MLRTCTLEDMVATFSDLFTLRRPQLECAESDEQRIRGHVMCSR